MTIAPYYILYKANVIVFVRYLGVGDCTLFFTLQNIFANHFHFTGSPLFLRLRLYIYASFICFHYIFCVSSIYFKLILQTK